MLIYSMQIPDLRSKQNPIVLTVLLKGKYQKKCQWIPSPKYILTLVSYNPKSESGVWTAQHTVLSNRLLGIMALYLDHAATGAPRACPECPGATWGLELSMHQVQTLLSRVGDTW